jgi:PAS domain S-box-containing protein
VAGTVFTRQLCLAVHKDETELLARLNTALAILNQTGRYAEIYKTWFGHLTPEAEVGGMILRWGLAAAAVGLVALTVVLVWTRAMKLRVARATMQLQAANQEIRDREAFLNTVIENLPVAIFGKDPRKGLTFTLWNNRCEQIFGLSKAEALGKSDYDFFPKDQSDWFREKDLEVIRSRKAIDIPVEVVSSKALGNISLFTRKVPLFDERGEPILLLGIAENRTEQLAMEEALRQAQKLESLGVLAGGIAHDFNNLLTAILGNLGLVRDQAEAGEPVDAFLDNIEKTVLRAADLTRQMLAYSGRGVFIKVPLALEEAVREMANLLKVSISKKVRLQFEFDAQLPAVEADPAQIQQVIMNLVTNASEAIGDAEGEILLSVRTVDLDAAHTAIVHPTTPIAPGRYLCLLVRDTGIGMSPETLARIFDPFFTTKFSGRGLGMSAMLGILKAHQAGIAVKSSPGQGTEFQVFLPATDAPVAPLVPQPATSVAPGQVTLLVVDDEPNILEATTVMLRQMDIQVIQARDGREAVEAYAKAGDSIRAVLMDLTMPRMDGLEAATEIHRLNPRARIVLTSGFSPSPNMDLGSAGVTGFLQKPFGKAALLAALKPVLGEDGT